MIYYGVEEVSPGRWCISVGFPGAVGIINLDGGELPKGTFKPWPTFDSKEQAETFIQGLQEA